MFRKGAGVAHGNETLSERPRLSSRVGTARGCGTSGVFGMNDPMIWEQTPKGSEEGRLQIIDLPNNFAVAGNDPTSPRT